MSKLIRSGSRWAWAERRLGWLAVPKIGILIITLQAAGFLMVMSETAWTERLSLIPDRVFEGEYWRLITFLALPLSSSPFWVLFALWFLYFVFDAIESHWGAFKTTVYVLTAVVLTWVFSLVTGYPVQTARHFESTLFLAAAALMPELEVSLFFVLPIKLKWLAVLAALVVIWGAIHAGWMERFYLLAVYFNFVLFFAPSALAQIKARYRRKAYERDSGR
jgi:hypothetical protein